VNDTLDISPTGSWHNYEPGMCGYLRGDQDQYWIVRRTSTGAVPHVYFWNGSSWTEYSTGLSYPSGWQALSAYRYLCPRFDDPGKPALMMKHTSGEIIQHWTGSTWTTDATHSLVYGSYVASYYGSGVYCFLNNNGTLLDIRGVCDGVEFWFDNTDSLPLNEYPMSGNFSLMYYTGYPLSSRGYSEFLVHYRYTRASDSQVRDGIAICRVTDPGGGPVMSVSGPQFELQSTAPQKVAPTNAWQFFYVNDEYWALCDAVYTGSKELRNLTLGGIWKANINNRTDACESRNRYILMDGSKPEVYDCVSDAMVSNTLYNDFTVGQQHIEPPPAARAILKHSRPVAVQSLPKVQAYLRRAAEGRGNVGRLLDRAENSSQRWPDLHRAIRIERRKFLKDGTPPDFEKLLTGGRIEVEENKKKQLWQKVREGIDALKELRADAEKTRDVEDVVTDPSNWPIMLEGLKVLLSFFGSIFGSIFGVRTAPSASVEGQPRGFWDTIQQIWALLKAIYDFLQKNSLTAEEFKAVINQAKADIRDDVAASIPGQLRRMGAKIETKMTFEDADPENGEE